MPNTSGKIGEAILFVGGRDYFYLEDFSVFDVESIEFSEILKFNILEKNFVIINTEYLVSEFPYLYYDVDIGAYCLKGRERTKMETFIQSCHDHFQRFCEKGGTILFLLEAFEKEILIIESGFHDCFQDIDLFFVSSLREFRGREVGLEGSEYVKECLRNCYEDWQYSLVIESENITPLLLESNTGKIVGGYQCLEKGLIVYLPLPKPGDVAIASEKFVKNILDLIPILRDGRSASFSLPTWASGFQFENEKRARIEKEKLCKEKAELILEIDKKIAEEEENIKNEERWKLLFTGKDLLFERIVKEAFECIGFTVVPGPEKRADLIARYKDEQRILVIEAKGRGGSKSAKEGDVRQLDTWMNEVKRALLDKPSEWDSRTEYYVQRLEELGIPVLNRASDQPCSWLCKGLLAINAFCDSPLDERRSPVFPHNVEKIIEKKEYSGVSGIQLLVMMLAFRKEKTTAEDILSAIFDKNGPVTGYDDWNDFLCKEVDKS